MGASLDPDRVFVLFSSCLLIALHPQSAKGVDHAGRPAIAPVSCRSFLPISRAHVLSVSLAHWGLKLFPVGHDQKGFSFMAFAGHAPTALITLVRVAVRTIRTSHRNLLRRRVCVSHFSLPEWGVESADPSASGSFRGSSRRGISIGNEDVTTRALEIARIYSPDAVRCLFLPMVPNLPT